jgi:spermidine/putrescine transport system permease protein
MIEARDLVLKRRESKMNTRKKKFSLSTLILILTAIFLMLPLLVIIVFSFNESRGSTFTHFSLKWYRMLFEDSEDLLNALYNSLFIAFTAGIASTAIATLAAIAVKWYSFRAKRYIQIITYLPMVLPDIILGISIVLFFAGVHMPLGLFTIFVAHTTFCIPFVYLTVLSRLDEFDHSVVEAARDLGATEFETLYKVIIPMIRPGILSGFIMAITLSLEDFIITFFVSGPGSTTLPIYMYSLIRFGISPVINALSFFMILSITAIAVTLRYFLKDIASIK